MEAKKILIILILTLWPTGVFAETYRLGTFNLAWFQAEPGGRFSRTQEEIKKLAEYIESLNVDVLALQEVKDEKAIKKLLDFFPSGKYGYSISSHKTTQRPAVLFNRSRTKVKKRTEIREIRVGRPRLRTGVVFDVAMGNFNFTLIVVHLKCCAAAPTRKKQLEALNSWLKEEFKRPGSEKDVVIVGDFNHQLRKSFMEVLSKGIGLYLTTNELTQAVCEPQEKRYTEPIDHIVVSMDAKFEYQENSIFMENIYESDKYPKEIRDKFSDHCPLIAAFEG